MRFYSQGILFFCPYYWIISLSQWIIVFFFLMYSEFISVSVILFQFMVCISTCYGIFSCIDILIFIQSHLSIFYFCFVTAFEFEKFFINFVIKYFQINSTSCIVCLSYSIWNFNSRKVQFDLIKDLSHKCL